MDKTARSHVQVVPLRDAAREFDKSEKTLRRWLAEAGVQAERDPADKRRLVLTREQVDLLKTQYDRNALVLTAPDSSRQESRMESLDQRVTALETSVAALSSLVAKVVQTMVVTPQEGDLGKRTQALEDEVRQLRGVLQAQGMPRPAYSQETRQLAYSTQEGQAGE
jgi:FAD/FMN-containing dehydrogenase